ncbi:hypothetical protein ACIQY5_21565 [Peribacillus frigoritolerans]|uniref:hypothetical protein n=1 Tax=Peribacillus frigoritolerans TaxID=450367 RepID=UPI0037FA4AF7
MEKKGLIFLKPPRDPFEKGDQNNRNVDKPEIKETDQKKQPFEKLPMMSEIENPQQPKKKLHFIFQPVEPKVNSKELKEKPIDLNTKGEEVPEQTLDPATKGEEVKKKPIDLNTDGAELKKETIDLENREKPVENDKSKITTWLKGIFPNRPNEVDKVNPNDIGTIFSNFTKEHYLKSLESDLEDYRDERVFSSISNMERAKEKIEDITAKLKDPNVTFILEKENVINKINHINYNLKEFNRLEDTDIFISFRKGISDIEQEKISENLQKISHHPLVKGVNIDILPDNRAENPNEIVDEDALRFINHGTAATYQYENDCITFPVENASDPKKLIIYLGHEIGHRVTNGPFIDSESQHDFPYKEILQKQKISINKDRWEKLGDDFETLYELREKIVTPNEFKDHKELLETKGARLNITQEELDDVLDKGGTVKILPAADFNRDDEENKDLPGIQVELLEEGGELVVLPKGLLNLDYPFNIKEHLIKRGDATVYEKKTFKEEMYAICSEYMLRDDLKREKPIITDGEKHHIAVSQFINYVKDRLIGDDSRDWETAVKDILGQLIKDIDGKDPEMTETALLWWGVSSDHVNHLKKKEMMIRRSFDEAYDLYEITEGKPIPVNKIAGVFRLTDLKKQRITFWEALHQDPKIDLKKMRGIQAHIQNSSVQDFHKWVSSNECAELFYNNSRAFYFEDDDVYFISEGNHRAIYAIMTGADTYHVTEILHHKLKEQKKIEFQQRHGGKIGIGLLKRQWLPSGISNYFLNSAKNDWEYTRLQKMINESSQQKKKD